MSHRERVRGKPLPILLGAAGIAVLAGVFSLGLEQPLHDQTYGGTWYPQGTPVDGDTSVVAQPSSSPSYQTGIGESSGGYLGSVESQADADQSPMEEALEIQSDITEAADAGPVAGSGTPYVDAGDLLVGAVIAAVVLGALSAYFFLMARRYSAVQKR